LNMTGKGEHKRMKLPEEKRSAGKAETSRNGNPRRPPEKKEGATRKMAKKSTKKRSTNENPQGLRGWPGPIGKKRVPTAQATNHNKHQAKNRKNGSAKQAKKKKKDTITMKKK